jgi:Protein of unknown function (DUF4050)
MDRITSTSSRSTTNSQSKSPTFDTQTNSPSLSSFHLRFRSSTSESASVRTPSADHADTLPSSKSEAARSAKRLLLSTVRDSWVYPALDGQPSQISSDREPLDYRIREEGSSDPDLLSDEPHDARDPMAFTDSDPYKFESPDAVANSVLERKRKRRRLLKEELEWNIGLRTWVDRRDQWCGAVNRRPTKRKKKPGEKNEENGRLHSETTDLLTPLSPMSTNSSSSTASELERESHDANGAPSEDNGPLLPIYPSFLPETNSIRASIKPAMYPAIYSKVVLQSLTPTVPVPLTDMVGALVQGWKSEGNWPPKNSAPATSILQQGSRRASELLRFRRRETAVAEKGRMRKSVGAVKKALGLRTSSGEPNGLSLKLGDEGRNCSINQSGLVEDDDPTPT